MDDERVIRQMGLFGTITGEVLLKMLLHATNAGLQLYQARQTNRTFKGEAGWFKFLQTSDSKDVKEFLKSEINLNAFKNELKKYGIGFAFKDQGDGKMLFVYHFKDKALVEQALSNVIKQLTHNPKDLNMKLVKTPRNMAPAEKIQYYKKEGQKLSQVKQKEVTRPLSPAPIKGGPSK